MITADFKYFTDRSIRAMTDLLEYCDINTKFKSIIYNSSYHLMHAA